MPPTTVAIRLTAKLAAERLRDTPAYVVAQRAGISPSLLSRIARGRAEATDEVALRIAAALDCAPTELGFAVEDRVA